MIARQRHLAVGIALLMGALAGCASGQVTHTADQESAVNGASGQAGPIAVRDAVFVYPSGDEHFYAAGSAAALMLTIVNTEGAEDRLVAVQSPVGQARLDGSTTIPGRNAVRAIAPDVTETTTTSAGPTSASTSAPTSTPTSVPGATTTAGAPTSGPATTSGPTASGPAATTSGPTATSGPSATTASASDFAPGELTIVLEKLTEDIRPGRTVLVVLLFEKAGELRLQVPIDSPDEPRGESAH